MTRHVRAHFDGRVLVPDESVDLPINQPLELEVRPCATNAAGNGEAPPSPELIRERLRTLDEFFRLPLLGEVPLEALRRENLYEERT